MQDNYFSGMRPSFNINGDLIMCSIEVVSGSEVIKSGEKRVISISLPHDHLVEECLKEGASFKLNSGGQILGDGKIINL